MKIPTGKQSVKFWNRPSGRLNWLIHNRKSVFSSPGVKSSALEVSERNKPSAEQNRKSTRIKSSKHSFSPAPASPKKSSVTFDNPMHEKKRHKNKKKTKFKDLGKDALVTRHKLKQENHMSGFHSNFRSDIEDIDI
mmetsp:Transcript_20279/g.25903  ORF Transcript_20279/g.25903 Transcript_20279/m.25903 type:complete len:136 (-) Transcript_20279:275-682(-)